MASRYTVEPIEVVGTHTLLEAPHWDIARQSLYFVDILERKIFRYDNNEDQLYVATIDGAEDSFGFIVPVEGQPDQFIVSVGARLLVVQWDGKSTTAKPIKTYAEVDQDIGKTRLNDGKVDPEGRIFAGTMHTEGDPFSVRRGRFYRFDKGIPTLLKKDINISNGLTWIEKDNKFFYIDSGDFNVKEYDYSAETGEISNERLNIQVPKEYILDGMTVDAQGFLYIAMFLGGQVIKVDPKAKRIMQNICITDDITQTTSVAFGGPNLDEMFVTTAAISYQPGKDGRLYKVTGLDVKGAPMYSAKV